MPFDPRRGDDGAPLPTCTDCPILRHEWVSEQFGPMATISFVIGWGHPGWAWSIRARAHAGARCEEAA